MPQENSQTNATSMLQDLGGMALSMNFPSSQASGNTILSGAMSEERTTYVNLPKPVLTANVTIPQDTIFEQCPPLNVQMVNPCTMVSSSKMRVDPGTCPSGSSNTQVKNAPILVQNQKTKSSIVGQNNLAQSKTNGFRSLCWDCRFGIYARARNGPKFCRDILRHTGPDYMDVPFSRKVCNSHMLGNGQTLQHAAGATTGILPPRPIQVLVRHVRQTFNSSSASVGELPISITEYSAMPSVNIGAQQGQGSKPNGQLESSASIRCKDAELQESASVVTTEFERKPGCIDNREKDQPDKPSLAGDSCFNINKSLNNDPKFVQSAVSYLHFHFCTPNLKRV
jgi:hypothetical protein